MTLERLEAARTRLAAALRTGLDTSPHRAAIVQIEQQLAQQHEQARLNALQAQRKAAQRFDERTAELIAQSTDAARLAAQRILEVQ